MPENNLSRLKRLLRQSKPRNFKELLPAVFGLDHSTYIDTVLPEINQYVLTDKADGIRTIVVVDHDVPARSFHVNGLNADSPNQAVEHAADVSIFDTEMLDSGRCLVFDVLQWHGQSTADRTFLERMKLLPQVEQVAVPNYPLQSKTFVSLNTHDYGERIRAFAQKKRPYETDGLVFTPTGSPFYKTVSFKWKPPEHLTIDFVAVRTGVPHRYLLLCGISSAQLASLGRERPRDSFGLPAQSWYFPVPFEPSYLLGENDPPVNELMHMGDIHGKIVECLWTRSGWKYIRTRTDRDGELKSGAYFGNNHRIAELTFMMIMHPLTLETLTQPRAQLERTRYFRKTDARYKTVRGINNYLKQLFIRTSTAGKPKACIVDLASGKGQDIRKYAEVGARRVLMVEQNPGAIDTIVERMYSQKSGPRLHIIEADLTQPVDPIVRLTRGRLPMCGQVHSVFCHFALHYLVADEAHAKQMGLLVSSLLANGGEFVFTAFDGRRVFDLLNKCRNRRWQSADGRFLVEALYNESHQVLCGFGYHVRVLLPCSSEPYEEALIDITQLDRVFTAFGLERVSNRSFEEYLPETQRYKRDLYDALTPDERLFIGLYAVSIYRKATVAKK